MSTEQEIRVCKALRIEPSILRHCHAQRPQVFACDSDVCGISSKECKENEYLEEEKRYPTGPALDAAIEEVLVERRLNLRVETVFPAPYPEPPVYLCNISANTFTPNPIPEWLKRRTSSGYGKTKLAARLNACEAAFCGRGKE